MAFPQTLDVFENPTPSTGLNQLSHAEQHARANDAIESLQVKVGADGSAVQSSHDYKLSGVTGAAKAVATDDSRLSDARTPTAHGHAQSDVTGLAASLAAKADVAHTHSLLPVHARVTGANATNTGQALADIAGLSIALLANSVYEFEAILSVQSSSSAGNQYGVQFSAAGATVEAQISGTLAAATSRSDRISALNTAAPAILTSGATGGVRIHGIIVTGANAGNLTIRHLKVTSGTATAFINSFLRATKIA